MVGGDSAWGAGAEGGDTAPDHGEGATDDTAPNHHGDMGETSHDEGRRDHGEGARSGNAPNYRGDMGETSHDEGRRDAGSGQ